MRFRTDQYEDLTETDENMVNEVHFRIVEANGVQLHVAQTGPEEGPLLLLLHGFPEFWYGWRHQIGPLAQGGFRVWAPDGRGYNLSDKPTGVRAYGLDELVADVVGLIDQRPRRLAEGLRDVFDARH